jgi:hypothetical protein
VFKTFSCQIVIIFNSAFFKVSGGLLDNLLTSNLAIHVPFTLEPFFMGEKCLPLAVCQAIAHFSGILDKSLETYELDIILFIIRGYVGFAIIVEDEIYGADITQKEKGFDYLAVFHYARAIKAEIYVFLIAQVA